MSGIVGFIGKTEEGPEIIKRMADCIRYRGKDAEGYYTEKGWALGQRVQQLSREKEPAELPWNEDRSVTGIFDGEIYNQAALRTELEKLGHVFGGDSQAELMLHCYEQWNVHFPEHVQGAYAMVFWNKEAERLLLIRDPFGGRPLYYGLFGDSFLFASEVKALLMHPEFKKEFNQEILASYLCFNSTPTQETFFKNVFRVDPGQYVLYEKGKVTKQSYFFLEFSGEKNTSAATIQQAMKNSIEQMKQDGVPFGSFLSGGVDSSYLVGLARPVKTYTVGYDNRKYDESDDARKLAEGLGIPHAIKKISKEEYLETFPKLIYYLDEPLADPSVVALYYAAQMAAGDVKVVTSGEGGDELFAGYNTYLEETQHTWYMKIPYPIRRLLSSFAGLFPEVRGLNFIYRRGRKLEDCSIGSGRIFRDEEARKIVSFSHQISSKKILEPLYRHYRKQSNLEKRQAVDFYFWLMKDFLHAGDRMTALWGLRVRTPYLTQEVYEAAMGLAEKDKIQGTVTKAALREAAQAVIPREACYKKKLGFPVPLRDWMREEDFYRVIQEAFDSPAAGKLFRRDKIQKLLKEHYTGKRDTYKKVWTIYTLILWYQEFFEK